MADETFDKQTGELSPAGGQSRELAVAGIESNQSLAVQLATAELQQDVVNAKAFPRSVAKVLRSITELVQLDEITAKECVYAVPRDGKTIRGPSIRLAEIIASQWGNCHCASRVVHVDKIEKYVESEGIFHDLETGMKRTARTRKSIAKRDGGVYSQDMIMTAGAAAASIAMREAILKGVPKAVWRPAFDHAENVIRGNVATLVERRGDAMKALAGIGVVPERVFAALGVAGLEEIGLDELADLFAMYQGVKNGDTNVDEVFPAVKKGDETAAKGGAKSKALNDRLNEAAGAGKGKAADAKKPAAESKPAETTTAKPKPAEEAKPKEEPAADDPIAKARKQGIGASRRGFKRTATPMDLREAGREAELAAYLAGYDAEEKKAEAAGQQ